jgi:hypothetical protein
MNSNSHDALKEISHKVALHHMIMTAITTGRTSYQILTDES